MWTTIGVLGIVGFVAFAIKYSGTKARIKYYFQGYFRALRNGLSEDEALESVKNDYYNSTKYGRPREDMFKDIEDVKFLVHSIICVEFRIRADILNRNNEEDEWSRVREEVDEVYLSLLPTYGHLLKNKK